MKHTTEIVSKKFLHAWDNNSYYALNMVLTRQEVVGIRDFYFSNLLLYRGGNIYELISNTFLTIHKYHSLFNKYAPLQAKYFVIHLMGSLYLHTLLNKAKVLYHLFDDVSYLQELLEKGIVPRVVAGDVDRMSFVVTTLPSLTYALTIAHRFCLFDYAYPIFATGNIGRFLYPLYKKYEEEKALKTVEKMLGNYLFFSEGGRESEGN